MINDDALSIVLVPAVIDNDNVTCESVPPLPTIKLNVLVIVRDEAAGFADP